MLDPPTPDSVESCAALRSRARSALERRSRDGYGGGGSATTEALGTAVSVSERIDNGGVGGFGYASLVGELTPGSFRYAEDACSSWSSIPCQVVGLFRNGR